MCLRQLRGLLNRLCNSSRMYCFSFSMNFLYWSLASLCLDLVPKTAPKSSTSPLNLLIDNVYAGRLKRLPRPPCTWWTPLPVQPPRPCPRTPLIALDSLVSEAQVIVTSIMSPPLLPAAGEAVPVSFVILVYLYFLNNFELELLSYLYVVNNPTCP